MKFLIAVILFTCVLAVSLRLAPVPTVLCITYGLVIGRLRIVRSSHHVDPVHKTGMELSE